MNRSPYFSRREFVRFISGTTAGLLAGGPGLLAAAKEKQIPFIEPSDEDAVRLADGLGYRVLISWGDKINPAGDKFGFNNDYLDFVRLNDDPHDLLLWVNHESASYGYFPTPAEGNKKTREDVELERTEVGGSILRLKKSSGEWKVVDNDQYNRRIDATTPIPFVAEGPIQGSTEATGTFANCAGGRTPWNTILSCEENYHYYTGEVDLSEERRYNMQPTVGWERFYDMTPEHFGWVVEIDPFTGSAKKHTSMGRFAHESATVVEAADGRCVVYSGDDKTDQFLYKLVASEPGSLDHGELYAADTINGKWLLLDYLENPALHGHFRSQLDLLVRTREAAALAGATPLDRPEDIERDPASGAVFVTLTKNKRAGRPFGSILKIEEDNNDPLSLAFNASTFLTGGEHTGFACPDNLAFDKVGNLWFTSDISGEELNHPPYSSFKNNGLFIVPMRGRQAGQVIQVGSAPIHAEFTGIRFSDDGQSLFLSVQHPGEESTGVDNLKSHWPNGGSALPRPSVIVIEGEFLNTFCA